MARIRSIKPEFFSSLTIGRLPMGARLLFIAMWCDADDAGRLLDSAKRLAGVAFPYDDSITSELVAEWVCALADNGLIVRYEADGKRLIQVAGWHHQRISHPTESRLPGPPETFRKSSGEIPESIAKNSVADLGSGSRILDLGSRIERVRAREDGAEAETKQEASEAPPDPNPHRPPNQTPIAQPDPTRALWATRPEPLSAYGTIPGSIGDLWAFQWRDSDIATHLKRVAPDLSETDRWDQTEDCLAYRFTLSDREFKWWLWPQGCVPRLLNWLERANSRHLDAQTARARAAKAGVYVADTKRISR